MTTTTKPSKIFRTWQQRLEDGVLTKSLCNQFAKSITTQAFGCESRGFKSNLTPDEARVLHAQIREQGGVRLTPEDEAAGLTWLKRNGVKPEPRGLGLHQAAVDLFSHFTYNGEATTFGWRGCVPDWQIHLTDGRIIEYSWVPWTAMAYERGAYEGIGWRWVA